MDKSAFAGLGHHADHAYRQKCKYEYIDVFVSFKKNRTKAPNNNLFYLFHSS